MKNSLYKDGERTKGWGDSQVKFLNTQIWNFFACGGNINYILVIQFDILTFK